MSTKNKQEILDAITECNILRLKTNEAVEFIQKQTKTKISERTYRRYKKELQESINNRLEQIGRTELINEVIQSIDLYKKIEHEYWKNYYSTESIKDKKSILDSITKSHYNLIKCYDNTNVVIQVKDWLESKFQELDKKKKQNKSDSELLTTYTN